MLEQWKEQLPPGYLLKEASIDKPYEEDACHCHFAFVKDNSALNDTELLLKYQWFIGEKALANFIAIPDATEEVKHANVGF